ncbi:bifunctional phosphoglucose/phosphomannose isomerase [Candidatus Bathyarchaeota archaeon]|nr:bifunctional phosphoglucose/phosphomannose isomerase [Candidatus Bathyarchaeota archaeon]
MTLTSILDDRKRLKELDSGDMLGIVEKSPGFMDWCIESMARVQKTRIIEKVSNYISRGKLKGIFVVGMGGSAISGDLLRDWLQDAMDIPIIVVRGYSLPVYITNHYLGIFLSYSGNTEETLSCFADAIEREVTCIGITSGGLLASFLERVNGLCIHLPSGYQPRAALLYLFTALAILMAGTGIVPEEKIITELEETSAILHTLASECGRESTVNENPMKQAALKVFKTIIAIYGHGCLVSVARRLKGQINENGKNPAYHDFFPELNHNETVGWEVAPDVSMHVSCILLRDEKQEAGSMGVRVRYTKGILEEKAAACINLVARGTSRLARMLSLVYMGDFMSIYLAFLNGKDPTPVTYIQGLKEELKNKVHVQEEIKARVERIIQQQDER